MAEEEQEGLIVDRIFETVRDGSGVSVTQVAEALDITERQVRNGVTALRRKHQVDSGDHVVSWSGRFWLARELEAAGHQLQPTPKGNTLKVVKPKPAKEPKGKTKEEILDDLRADLGDHPDAEKIAQLVCKRYDEHITAEEQYRETLVKSRQMVQAADAQFKDTIEAARTAGDVDQAVNKLYSVEVGWQTREEKRAESVELRKEALDKKKKAANALAGIIENCRQLDLSF